MGPQYLDLKLFKNLQTSKTKKAAAGVPTDYPFLANFQSVYTRQLGDQEVNESRLVRMASKVDVPVGWVLAVVVAIPNKDQQGNVRGTSALIQAVVATGQKAEKLFAELAPLAAAATPPKK